MADRDPEAFTRDLMEDLRAHGGQTTGGPMAGQPLLILTTTGTKSGNPRQVVLTFTRDGDAYVVAGSKGGAPTDPHWFNNLRSNPGVKVEAHGKSFDARAKVAEGGDRDRLWARHVDALPQFAEYPKTAGRVIPMIRLMPVG